MLGLAGALLALGLHALAGFPTLAAANGDNDSLLRLVEIRDLIGGQAWFDLHQYRMGPPGGFVMHWSRLVDAPIAAIIVVVSALTGKPATGETVALFAWTTPLMAAALTLLLRIARSVYDEWTIMPAFIICTAALHFSGVFAPGDIDHHNVQLTLCLAAITALIAGRGHIAGIATGTACALMLAVGMETLPYVAVAGMTAAATYLLGDRPPRPPGRPALEWVLPLVALPRSLRPCRPVAGLCPIATPSRSRNSLSLRLRESAWQQLRCLPCSAAALAQGSPRCLRSVSPSLPWQ